jgi:adenine-specific DNA-methyltransferase
VEGKLDIDKLLNLCGEYITDDFEKYEFKWKGKSDCVQLAGKRSAGTLRPCPEESVNWDTTKNVYIEGDNLEVLKLLQTAYFRRVKMIYIDPPYNTGNDFVYADHFADPLERYKEVTQQTTKSNPETMGRFHTNWLNMMWPRLRLAANLLRDDGVVFISIDDHEVRNLKYLCDEIFGEENFVCQFIWKSKLGKVGTTSTISATHEYILCYAKRYEELKFTMIETQNDGRKENLRQWGQADRREDRPSMWYPITIDGIEVYPIKEDGTEVRWRVGQTMAKELLEKGQLQLVNKGNRYDIYRLFEAGISITPYDTLLLDEIGTTAKGATALNQLALNKIFDYSKPIELVKFFAKLCTQNDDIILDFFSGSATTAHAVMQLNAEDGGNCRFVLVQLPEVTDEKSEAYKAGYKNICEIGKERIRRAGARLRNQTPDSSNQIAIENLDTGNWQLDTGFKVFKLDSSNLKLWDDSPLSGEEAALMFEERLRGMLELIKKDRSDIDVTYEVLLKLGQDLCSPILPIDLGDGRTVYGVGEDVTFIVCLAPNITPEDAVIMADYAPGRIVFSDDCFSNTEQKSNVRLVLKDNGISVRSL